MAKLINPNRTSAKAVTEIDAVYFYNSNGTEPKIDAQFIENGDLFPVATLKGSVEINQEDITINKINIDQSNVPIGITTEPGDFNFAGDMPSMLSDDLAKFLTKGDEKVYIDNKVGYGYTLDGKILEMAVIVRMKTGEYLIFPRTNVTCTMKMEDNVMLLHFAGQVLGATHPDNRDVYILADSAALNATTAKVDFGVSTSAADDKTADLTVTYDNIDGEISAKIVGASASQFSFTDGGGQTKTLTPAANGQTVINLTYDSSAMSAVHEAELVLTSNAGERVVKLVGETKIP